MTSVFTICSINYLAQAKALGDSVIHHNPEYTFSVFLVDRFEGRIERTLLAPFDIIPVEEIGIPEFADMASRYNITELNTAVKPFIFNHLFNKIGDLNAIIYLDPDIVAYQPFTDLNQHLLTTNIIVTPHFTTPIMDNLRLAEQDILNTGLYNLGFLAVKRSEETTQFLGWWMAKLAKYCLVAVDKGLFVDQIWINFVPLYFKSVLIFTHPGYNMAYWNLHERKLSNVNGTYMVNDTAPLVFYHFSGYLFNKPTIVSKYQSRYDFESRTDIITLFKDYTDVVKNNGYDFLHKMECYFVRLKNEQIAAYLEWVRKDRFSLARLKRVAKRKFKFLGPKSEKYASIKKPGPERELR